MWSREAHYTFKQLIPTTNKPYSSLMCENSFENSVISVLFLLAFFSAPLAMGH